MSRSYDCNIYIDEDVSLETETLIEESTGNIQLCGGMSEEDFTQEVAESIWKSEKRFFPVEITMTYLDELPSETYSFGEKAYSIYTGNIE